MEGEGTGGLTQQLDNYCERTGPELWSEPINAITNAAFLIAAFVMWRRTRGALPLANLLIVILAAIGIGSFLFHTVATVWAAIADTAPIGLFVLVYVFAANWRYWGLPWWGALIGAALFIPYAAAAGAVFARLPFFAVSSFYWPIALAIAAYGAGLMARAPETGRGLLIGAGILSASLAARSLDEALCDAIPFGTHFLWHVLNGVMLGWMIEVYRRHMTGGAPAPSGRALDARAARR